MQIGFTVISLCLLLIHGNDSNLVPYFIAKESLESPFPALSLCWSNASGLSFYICWPTKIIYMHYNGVSGIWSAADSLRIAYQEGSEETDLSQVPVAALHSKGCKWECFLMWILLNRYADQGHDRLIYNNSQRAHNPDHFQCSFVLES